MRGRWWVVFLGMAWLTAASVLGGCRVDAVVLVDADASGAGTIEVRVVADAAAVTEAGGEAAIATEDLTAGGWRVERTPGLDGSLTVVGVRSFANPDEANEFFVDIAGPDITRSLTFERSQDADGDRFSLSGVVDLSGGVDAFSDSALAELLGSPLGQDAPTPEQAQMHVQVVASVAGSPEVEATGQVGDAEPVRFDARQSIPRPEPAALRADADRSRSRSRWAAAAAVVAMLLALLAVLRHRG